jgi:parallel beta-helix repeat protein
LEKAVRLFRKTVSIILLSLLVTSALALALNVQPVKASGTIYIRADGSIDPLSAPIQRNGDSYTLTGNISANADGIVIERHNLTLDGAGYTLQGGGSGRGIDLSGRIGVSVQNTEIRVFTYGIYLESSSGNSITSNNVTDNGFGISVYYSSGNNISNNIIENHPNIGVGLFSSDSDMIAENIFKNNTIGLLQVSCRNIYLQQNIYSSNNISIYSNDTLDYLIEGSTLQGDARAWQLLERL